MQVFMTGIFILVAVYLGYIMGRGEKLSAPKALRFMARNDSQETEALRKIEKRALNGGR